VRVTRCNLACIALVLSGAGTGTAAIRFEDFASVRELTLVGDATVARKTLRLTPAKGDRSGAAWLHEKQPVGSGFETTFQFRLTHQGGLGHGADGFAFVLQNSGPEALGGRGSAGGFAVTDPAYHHKEMAIPWSIAVFFDTYRNTDEGDPSANYVAFCTYGKPSELRWPAPRLAFTPNLSVKLKDRRVHTARILFQPPVLSVFLDDSPAAVLESVVDLSIVVDEHGSAWVGFTASTGGGYENHDILNWSFTETDVSSSISVVSSDITFLTSTCLPDRNLCTPESAVVDHRGAGYHVILPGNLEWGASIPNPPTGTAVVTSAHGIVCWDLRARGSDGCSGPSGNGKPAGAGFLAADAPAGALIVRTHEGRVWFSVNGRSGVEFKDNQGFYEFDLEIKPVVPKAQRDVGQGAIGKSEVFQVNGQ
jgi:Legume lectin domain